MGVKGNFGNLKKFKEILGNFGDFGKDFIL
jgi:hypothetical protein